MLEKLKWEYDSFAEEALELEKQVRANGIVDSIDDVFKLHQICNLDLTPTSRAIAQRALMNEGVCSDCKRPSSKLTIWRYQHPRTNDFAVEVMRWAPYVGTAAFVLSGC